MLHRQALLLATIASAGRTLSRLELMKLLFLERQEMLQDVPGLYDFLPYKFGPFSFLVYRDLTALQRDGLLHLSGRFVQTNASVGMAALAKLPSNEHAGMLRIMQEHGSKSPNALLHYVYAKYPWYASRSLVAKRSARASYPIQSALFTMGYEGITVDAFLNALLVKDVATVIDVRRNPVSHKYGFSKSSLRRLSQSVGLSYIHFASLGIPSSYRRGLHREEDFADLFRTYELSMLPEATDALDDACRTATQSRAALVCFERSPQHCHRSFLARAMSSRTGLTVVHL